MEIVRQLTDKMKQLFQEDLRFTKGAQHCHTQNSLDDGFQTEADLCRVALENGAEVAFISDHGTAMGWDDFDEAAKKIGIKPVFGIEAYYLDDVTNMKSHLVLYAMNNEGMRQIQLAMSRGVIIEDGRTCLNDETLEMLKGGNVVATSACINGVIGSIVLYNDRIDNKIEKLGYEIDEFADSLSIFEESKRMYDEADNQVSILRAEVSEAKAAAKKSFTGKQKQVESMRKKLEKAKEVFDKFMEDSNSRTERAVKTALAQLEVVVEDSDEFQEGIELAEMKYNQRVAQIKSEMEATAAIAKTLDEKTKLWEEAKERKSKFKAELDSVAKDVAKAENKQAKIEELDKQKLTKEQAMELYKKRLNKMLEVFGENFFIEIQNHGLDLERTIYRWMVRIARESNIPIIAANDAHVARNSNDDVAARQIRKSCRWKKWDTPQEDDTEYYIKNDRELALALYQIFPEDVVIEAMSNVSKLVSMCNATIVTESHAPKAKVENPKEEMVRVARQNIFNKYGTDWGQEHEDRFNYEVSIIDSMGFNDYFVITWDILNVARIIGGLSYEKLDELKRIMNDMTLEELLDYINKHNTEVNISVGLGRGSGAGSLVCYLLGITNIDPFKYDLLFERFLNPERVTMPDIDSDFRTDIKDVLLIYLKKKYGERAVAQILTKSYLQGKSAIDKVVMILGDRDGRDYRYIASKLKNKSGVDFGPKKTLEDNRTALMAGVDSEIEQEIVETAILMDGNLDHTGLHAAGVVISDNDDLAEYIPVAWDAGFETWKTQCDMVQCESKHGLLKMDLLLLKTLDILTYALRLIEKNHGVKIDIEHLPMEEEVIKSIYATGDTKAVFQFESGGMVKFLRQLQPTCIEDIIAANALYRPGPMDYIPDYVNAKHSGNVVYDCPELEPILKGTYGVIVYQEQVQRIVRDLAGYSLGRADLVRRAMSKKKEDVLQKERQNFVYGNEEEGIIGCVKNGIKEEVANVIFDKMIDFAKYAFNKSHAAAYSETSYMTAWVKYHYPTEFLCAALNFVGAQKEIPSLIADAKKHGIEVLRPDINKSQADFSTENGNIRFGLKFLANAKSRATAVVDVRENGFKTFKSFIQVKPGKQMAEACIYSGALDCYCKNNVDERNALLLAYAELSDIYDDICKVEERINSATKDDAREKAKADYELLVSKWENYTSLPKAEPMSLMERLTKEQEYTSVYFTGDPLDNYEIDTSIKDYKTIDMLEDGESAWLAATMSDQKDLKTKKDALPMMSGRLTDRTGTIDCIIFPKAFAKVSEKLQTVMLFKGQVNVNGEGEDAEAQFVISDVKALPEKSQKVIVWFDDYNKTKELLKSNNVGKSKGLEAWLGGKNSKLYRSGAYVTETFLKENNINYTIQ